MFKKIHYATLILAIGGLQLIVMGLYFVFMRPALLPEDFNYMGSTRQNIEHIIPGLLNWTQKVFWVMGGYIFTTGTLIVFISFTSFQDRIKGVFIILLFAGISSIGLMTVVNFLIGSDFKWLLMIFTLTWAIALTLYKLHKLFTSFTNKIII
ncbi:hypothetical protein [Cytophaga aurantiaca]|uniref:hypothetical protein n=1 Tax=Cytophaga aurantiaca TaxID=29530 RepID=UPI00037C67D7|nr:hypothetical protein [Cytophaga aurantiaca]